MTKTVMISALFGYVLGSMSWGDKGQSFDPKPNVSNLTGAAIGALFGWFGK